MLKQTAAALLVCALCATAEPGYPSWFLSAPPDGGVRTSVGYAGRYTYPENSYDEAFLDGAWRLYADRALRISGEADFASSPIGKAHLGSDYQLQADSTGFGQFCKGLVRLDSAMVGDLALVWVGTGSVKIAPPTPSKPAKKGKAVKPEKPSWLENPPHDDDYVYEIDLAASYEHPESTWREAERRARIKLALAFAAKFETLDKRLNSHSQRVSRTATDVLLRDVQTLGRWKDPATGACWVMVRGKI
jgi:hypothetical protein